MPAEPTPALRPAPRIWDYIDCRAYLQAYLDHKRSCGTRFSVRQFCLRAGISTENYLLRVIRGDRRLGHKLAERFIHALPLIGAEADYFRSLVAYGLAATPDEKDQCLRRLEISRRIHSRKRARSAPVTDHSILRHWYLGAIWELASCPGVDLSAKVASQMLRPKVSHQEAKEAISFLEQMGYLERRGNRLVQSDIPVVTTNGKTDPLLRINHKETVALAVSAVDLPIEERGYFGLTLAVSKKRLPEIKKRMKAFMDELQGELALDPEADTVYRVNSHVFPLSCTHPTRSAESCDWHPRDCSPRLRSPR